MLASDVLAQARGFLQDESSALQRWSDDDLLGFLNDAQIALLNLKPDALTAFVTHTCSTEARQTATGVNAVLDVVRNIGGPSITLTRRDVMDRYVPSWRDETGTEVRHAMLDTVDESVFWVWPVCDTADIELHVTPLPTRLLTVGDTIEFADIWVPALTDYVAYRALASDLDSPTNAQLAGAWFQQFQGKVGVRDEAEMKIRGKA